jgi:uncharacterized protein involved in exopolysaccharide biosynthesis
MMGQLANALTFAWTHKRLIVIPALLFTTATSVVAYSLPVRYRAESILMVRSPRLADEYAPSKAQGLRSETILELKETVLSRRTLERIVDEFKLYAGERRPGVSPEALVDRLRHDVAITEEGDNSLRVSVTADTAHSAKDVTERLTIRLISEWLRTRDNEAQGATSFLEGEIDQLGQEMNKFATRIGRQHQNRQPLLSDALEFEVLQETYRALIAKRQQARMAHNLERRQIGVQLTLTEPARMPSSPVGPDRRTVVLGGATAGLTLGLVLLAATARRRAPAAR